MTRGVAVVSIVLALAACKPPFARLDGILVADRPALPEEFGRLQVIRAGETRDGSPGMGIVKGDTIMTAADGIAVVTLKAGWQVIFEPGTVAKIENPSIFVKVGKLIIKKLQEVKEALTVNNEFVSAGVEGTEFVFEVTPDSAVRISVLEGRVVVRSQRGGWDSTTYEAGEAGMIKAGAAPSPRRRLDPAEVRAIREHVQNVERVVRPVVPNVRGLTEPAARDALARAGLRTGLTERIITRQVSAGVVVSSVPPGGSRVRTGDPVTLQVEDSSLIMPQVIGLPLERAVELLRHAGFTSPDTTGKFSRDARVGTVLEASPRVGDAVSSISRIRLVVARGPVDTTGATSRCTVPNLIERSEQAAREMLKRASLQTRTVTRRRYGDLVTRQSPAAGTAVLCGSPVDLEIGTDIGE